MFKSVNCSKVLTMFPHNMFCPWTSTTMNQRWEIPIVTPFLPHHLFLHARMNISYSLPCQGSLSKQLVICSAICHIHCLPRGGSTYIWMSMLPTCMHVCVCLREETPSRGCFILVCLSTADASLSLNELFISESAPWTCLNRASWNGRGSGMLF